MKNPDNFDPNSSRRLRVVRLLSEKLAELISYRSKVAPNFAPSPANVVPQPSGEAKLAVIMRQRAALADEAHRKMLSSNATATAWHLLENHEEELIAWEQICAEKSAVADAVEDHLRALVYDRPPEPEPIPEPEARIYDINAIARAIGPRSAANG